MEAVSVYEVAVEKGGLKLTPKDLACLGLLIAEKIPAQFKLPKDFREETHNGRTMRIKVRLYDAIAFDAIKEWVIAYAIGKTVRAGLKVSFSI